MWYTAIYSDIVRDMKWYTVIAQSISPIKSTTIREKWTPLTSPFCSNLNKFEQSVEFGRTLQWPPTDFLPEMVVTHRRSTYRLGHSSNCADHSSNCHRSLFSSTVVDSSWPSHQETVPYSEPFKYTHHIFRPICVCYIIEAMVAI